MSNNIQIIGYIGGIVTTSSIYLQIYKTFTTKSSNDLGWFMLSTNIIGCSMICIYATLIDNKAIYIPLIFTVFGLSILIILKFIYDNKDDRNSQNI